MSFSNYEVGRFMPTRVAMREALGSYDIEVQRRFENGLYSKLFGGVTHRDAVVTPADWARGYAKNHEFLEAGALQAREEKKWLSADKDLAFARARDAANSVRENRVRLRTVANVATDISKPFEDWLQDYTNRLPARTDFAVTVEDVAFLESVMSRVKAAPNSLDSVSVESILQWSSTPDEFLLRVLATRRRRMWSASPEFEDLEYQEAVNEWVGEERGRLFAIDLAEENVTLDEVREYMAAGLAPEYALTLTRSTVPA